MAFILLGVGLALVIASKIFYNQRCAAGQGIPYNQKEKLMFYVGCVQFSLRYPDVPASSGRRPVSFYNEI